MSRYWMMVTLAGVLALLASPGSAVAAQEHSTPQPAAQETPSAPEKGVPKTPEEHFARAAMYKEKAASARREAEEHRKMLAGYKARQSSPALETKLGQEPPWVKQMRQHCERYIKAAEAMAAEADKFAEFHRMRGEEMRGK